MNIALSFGCEFHFTEVRTIHGLFELCCCSSCGLCFSLNIHMRKSFCYLDQRFGASGYFPVLLRKFPSSGKLGWVVLQERTNRNSTQMSQTDVMVLCPFLLGNWRRISIMALFPAALMWPLLVEETVYHGGRRVPDARREMKRGRTREERLKWRWWRATDKVTTIGGLEWGRGGDESYHCSKPRPD